MNVKRPEKFEKGGHRLLMLTSTHHNPETPFSLTDSRTQLTPPEMNTSLAGTHEPQIPLPHHEEKSTLRYCMLMQVKQ